MSRSREYLTRKNARKEVRRRERMAVDPEFRAHTRARRKASSRRAYLKRMALRDAGAGI